MARRLGNPVADRDRMVERRHRSRDRQSTCAWALGLTSWSSRRDGHHLRLGVGRYQFTVEGRPTKGGLYLGVLDATLNQWITTANYWADQDGYEKGVMTVTFSFAIPTEVRFVLSNWNPRSERSTWTLSSA